MSRLTWAKAKPALAGQFAEWPDQWPQRLAPVHLARLQAPPNGNDWSLTRAFDEAISDACAAGELAHERAAFVFPPVVAWASLEDSPGAAAARWRAQCVTRQLPAVTAGDFVAWMHKQSETPSAHIAAWLEATGGACELSPPSDGPAIRDRGLRVKRATLIQRNTRRWPTIERDLKDASSNGLSAEAKADGIGFWWEGDALKWAEVRGKLTATNSAASLTSVVHRMVG